MECRVVLAVPRWTEARERLAAEASAGWKTSSAASKASGANRLACSDIRPPWTLGGSAARLVRCPSLGIGLESRITLEGARARSQCQRRAPLWPGHDLVDQLERIA